jgi:hypothetical protein
MPKKLFKKIIIYKNEIIKAIELGCAKILGGKEKCLVLWNRV